MILLIIILSVLIVYILQSKIYNKYTFDNIYYDVSISAKEVFAGEDIFIYEEIVNAKTLPIASVRVDTTLPHGLKFCLNDKTKKKGKRDKLIDYNQSVFVLRNNGMVKRRWRITCQIRGIYNINKALLVTNDLLGLNSNSKEIKIEKSQKNQIVVFPQAINLEKHFTSSFYNEGDVIVARALLSDPMLISGTREYNSFDPMKSINWKSTAAHDKLMVNVEDYTEINRFNIILNMQSRPIELHINEPSSPEHIEMCITVCASILDKISSDNIPVRIFANTPAENIADCVNEEDDIGKKVLVTPTYRGKNDILSAFRMLASLKLEISCPFDKMMDYIILNPYLYSDGGNIIIISSYIDERMIIFHDILEKNGIHVIFYVMTVNQNIAYIPPNVSVYYKTYI